MNAKNDSKSAAQTLHMLVTVDCVVFGVDTESLKILLVRRKIPPFVGSWALPGGFVRKGEGIEEAAVRELRDETGLKNVYLEQLFTFGEANRDPRGRVISIAHFALVQIFDHQLFASSDAEHVAWFSIDDTPTLVFDHKEILEMALMRLRNKLHYEPVVFELLPRKFTLTELQQVCETVWDTKLDKRNFRKRVLNLGVLEELDEVQEDVAHRAARLYRYNEREYKRLRSSGVLFAI